MNLSLKAQLNFRVLDYLAHDFRTTVGIMALLFSFAQFLKFCHKIIPRLSRINLRNDKNQRETNVLIFKKRKVVRKLQTCKIDVKSWEIQL